MAISGAQQVAGHAAETGAARGRNNAKLKNFHRQNKEYQVEANLENVKYLSDVQEQTVQQDQTYQAMLDQWSDTDAQLKNIFAQQDFAIEDAIVKMHQDSYAGTQTGATAARLAGKSAVEAGRTKSRALYSKMMAVKEADRSKQKTYKAAKHDSRKLFMDVAFAPVHGFSPAAPELEAGPSKAGLLLGLAGTGLQGYKDWKASRPVKVGKGNDSKGGGSTK
jgi:hypothetical protein